MGMLWRISGWRMQVPHSVAQSCLLGLLVLAPLAAGAASPQPSGASRTIGLVLTDWRYALYQTPGKEECPDGLQPSEVAQFKALPDPVGHLNKFGGTTQNRGPNGENANY